GIAPSRARDPMPMPPPPNPAPQPALTASHHEGATIDNAPAERPRPDGFEILEELGRGGMGVVYKARQFRPDRLVALKLLHAADGHLARFRREADAIARLQHPNVVLLYQVGEYRDRPYLIMEYAPGGPLSDRLRGAPLPCAEAARLVAVVARAVHAA